MLFFSPCALRRAGDGGGAEWKAVAGGRIKGQRAGNADGRDNSQINLPAQSGALPGGVNYLSGDISKDNRSIYVSTTENEADTWLLSRP
jgi:hypothetical protein